MGKKKNTIQDDQNEATNSAVQDNEESVKVTNSAVQDNEESAKVTKKGKRSKRAKDDLDYDIEHELEKLAMEAGITPAANKTKKENEPDVNNKDMKTNDENVDKKTDVERNGQDSKKDKKNGTEKKIENANKKDKQNNAKSKNEVTNKKDNKQNAAKGKNEDANKKGGKGVDKKDEEKKKSKKGPSKKMLESVKEMLAKQKEEDERRKEELLEAQRKDDERIRLLEEQKKLEEEKREKLRQKQKDKMKKLKEEGKFLTPKQKLDQKRAKASLEFLKASGLPIPGTGTYEGTASKRIRRRKNEDQSKETSPKPEEEKTPEPEPVPEKAEEPEEEEIMVEEEVDDVRDAWDQLTDSEDENGDVKENNSSSRGMSSPVEAEIKESHKMQSIISVEYSREIVEHETKQSKVIKRLEERKLLNEKNKTKDNLRSPVICVLGHVDHGKTKILDKLKGTNVLDSEAGHITQEIRATIVSMDIIRNQTRMVDDFDIDSITFPGLLIIDTPGHESFSNLRNRGSSLCDFAILVIDINQGVESTTRESIKLLRAKKIPFLVALNKIDKLFDWNSNPNKDVRQSVESQQSHTQNDFNRRIGEVTQDLNMEGINVAIFWNNPNPKEYVSLVPTNAMGGDGIGNLISSLCSLCQKRMWNKLQFSEELQCTVLEVSTIQGHGTSVYAILVNGRLKEGDTIIVAGTEGPIQTQIRSLHIPKPRSRFQYDEYKEVKGTQGVMVAAKELDKAIAGWSLSVAYDENEIEYIKKQVDDEFKRAMKSMKVDDKGVYVQASSIGALEALLTLFKTNMTKEKKRSPIPYSGIKVGPVVKKDVMKASAMLEHDPMFATILAFNVKVEKDAQELADKEGVKIFCEPIIYHLVDRFKDYKKSYRKKKQDENRNVAIFPCRLRILPDKIFNKRDPIVFGVSVEAGSLRIGTPLCVPAKECVEIGVVTSLEFDHKTKDRAEKGDDVCVKIEPLPGHTPKLFGRHFDEQDELVSKITRETIDACKEFFREVDDDLDHLTKSDWKLIAELKRQFRIL